MTDNGISQLNAAELEQVGGGFFGGCIPGFWPPGPPTPGQPSFPGPFPIPLPPRRQSAPSPVPWWPGTRLQLLA